MYKNDEDLIEQSMKNAYLLITNKLSFNELFDYNGCSLPYHPKKNINNDVFNELIDYFCSKEEYEEALKTIPQEVDWALLSNYEAQDYTIGAQELACSSGDGGCEVVDL